MPLEEREVNKLGAVCSRIDFLVWSLRSLQRGASTRTSTLEYVLGRRTPKGSLVYMYLGIEFGTLSVELNLPEHSYIIAYTQFRLVLLQSSCYSLILWAPLWLPCILVLCDWEGGFVSRVDLDLMPVKSLWDYFSQGSILWWFLVLVHLKERT